MLDFIGTHKRSHTAGSLRKSDVGTPVTLMGWVHRRRDLGGLIFIDLRDVSGTMQIVFHPEQSAVHQKPDACATNM